MSEDPRDLTRRLERSRRRVRDLEIEASLLRAGLASVKADLERIGASRAWRWGHGLTRMLARLSGRRTRTAGAVAAALDRLAHLERALGGSLAGPAVPPAPQPERRRVPQDGDPRALGDEVRRRLGPPPRLADTPRVSIIVVTHDGLGHTRRLVAGLTERTDYPELELVIVDNASSDGTREWLAALELPFDLRIEANDRNASFAVAANQGAALARGPLLLFLNNDVEPIEAGWLHELVASLEGAVAAGARLVHGAMTDPEAPSGWIVQHRGIRFRLEQGALEAYNAGEGDDAFAPGFGATVAYPAATAACLLVRREAFAAAGGFSDRYRYGTEDVDLGLRLTAEGHRVVGAGRAVLVHRESSTQTEAGREFMRLNRLANRSVFAREWGPQLRREIRLEQLNGGELWTEDPPHMAITTTSADPSEGWGDWYTAHELGDALTGLGWRVSYVERREDRWYALPDGAETLLVLLDAFDLRRVGQSVLAVAWIRNWTDRWLARPWLDRVAALLVSSGASAHAVEDATGRSTVRFPLATNPERFSPGGERTLDYVFAGNRWGDERAIEHALAPRDGEAVAIHGHGWERVPALGAYAQGALPYDGLPDLYRSARIVLDDTAGPTRPWAAVNARVFDALACGTPVITDCAEGVRELFDAEFPTWDSPASLRAELDALLSDAARRDALAQRYRAEVLEHHTYARRARRLVEVVREVEERLSFCIKVPAPSWEEAPRWGDYHFAEALQRELVRRGHRVLVQVLPEWESGTGDTYDVAVVLRGLSRHQTRPAQLNVLWNISHPTALSPTECDGYDLVAVASHGYAARLRESTETEVIVLEQATDTRRFFPDPGGGRAHELLFVGNSRYVRRRVLDDLLPTDRDLGVYGANWNGLLDGRHVIADHVSNEELRHLYSAAGLVLNDHWDDMREHGFISNRVYDAVACGAVVVSDRVEGIEERFSGAVVAYDTREDLREIVDRLLADPQERAARGAAGRERVLAAHTFSHRVDALLAAVEDRIAATGHPLRITT